MKKREIHLGEVERKGKGDTFGLQKGTGRDARLPKKVWIRLTRFVSSERNEVVWGYTVLKGGGMQKKASGDGRGTRKESGVPANPSSV